MYSTILPFIRKWSVSLPYFQGKVRVFIKYSFFFLREVELLSSCFPDKAGLIGCFEGINRRNQIHILSWPLWLWLQQWLGLEMPQRRKWLGSGWISQKPWSFRQVGRCAPSLQTKPGPSCAYRCCTKTTVGEQSLDRYDNSEDSLQTVKMEFFLDRQALLSWGIYHHLTPAKRATQRIAVVVQCGLQCGFPGSHFVSDLYQLHSAQNSVVPCRV